MGSRSPPHIPRLTPGAFMAAFIHAKIAGDYSQGNLSKISMPLE